MTSQPYGMTQAVNSGPPAPHAKTLPYGPRIYLKSLMMSCIGCSINCTTLMPRRRGRALIQPWVWSLSDFIFSVSAYEGRWPVFSLAVSSSHRQCTVGVLIIAGWGWLSCQNA